MSISNELSNITTSETPTHDDLMFPSQTTNLTVPLTVINPPDTIAPSPSLSFADSFSTAFTSSSADENQDTTIMLALPALAPPQSLRKSISVDSFAHYGREASRSARDHVVQTPESPRTFHFSPVIGLPLPEKSVEPGRHRGDSLSAVHKELPAVAPLDSDIDRYDPQNLVNIDRFRRSSLKTPESPKAFIRGGDLPLPSRAPNLIPTPSLSSLTSTSTASSSLESKDAPVSTSSAQNPPKRTSNYTLAPSGRQRSGSLGVHMGGSSRKMTTHSHISPIQTRAVGKDIVLLVIGTKGCGKSTLINTGLARFERKEQQIPSDGVLQYQRGNYKIQLDENESFVSVAVIETELQLSLGLVKWPNNLPPIDGIIICYDCSNLSSYQPIEILLRGYKSVSMPIMVLECKSDLKHKIDSSEALQTLKQYDTGLIKVSNMNDEGSHKMWQSFHWILKAILRQRGPNSVIDDRNPASPTLLTSKDALWEHSSANTPTGSPMTLNHSNIPPTITMVNMPQKHDPPQDPPLTAPISSPQPDQQASTDDITNDPIPATLIMDVPEPVLNGLDERPHNRDVIEHSTNLPARQTSSRERKNAKKSPRPSQWADLDDLLDKLLFLAVSGDDPTFTTHFLLTYRRFATPRGVLLAMQKRMRQLDNPTGDPMFACFAQMRICHLLEIWIRDFSHDFSVKGTAGALNALIKSIISKTHLLHYGSEFLPFLEQLPGLVDQDAAWALKADIADNDSDEYEEEDEEDTRSRHPSVAEHTNIVVEPPIPSNIVFPSRERKQSLPLTKTITSPPSNGMVYQDSKQYLKDLVKLAHDVFAADSDEIAQEITRHGVRLFLVIKPRDWLAFTFISGKKKETEPISAFNTMSNHLAAWVVSLILCHDRPKARARQIEKFVEIGQKLRAMNNYSALRAFVAGINNAADDATMEHFKQKSPDASKNLMSWDVLLQQVRSHRAYRLALRNSKGACIPAMEVHISDLIKAHEGNGDVNEDAPTKIHWGKFNMMGRFIAGTLQCQSQCRNSNDYDFSERPSVAELITRRPVMSEEMQKSRLDSNDFDIDDSHPAPVTSSRSDVPTLRRLFFW